MKKKGVIVSLFLNPDIKEIEQGFKTGTHMVEIHTGYYANLFDTNNYTDELDCIIKSAEAAKKIGFEIAVGHGLNYQNIFEIAKIKDVVEFNIGHSILSRAIFTGLGPAVKEMRDAITEGRKK